MKILNVKLVIFSLLLAIISTSLYLILSRLTYRSGFPLDDAWIHQTYARNLALHGEWSYIPGIPSAGSTAPLWTILLAVGYLFNIAPSVWSNLLGIACLVALAIFGSTVVVVQQPTKSPLIIAITLLSVLFEYHLVWAALSGMETILFSLAVCLIIFNLGYLILHPVVAGVLLGLLTWVRPDGITLLGPVLFCLFVSKKSIHGILIDTLKLSIGLILILFPYLVLNWFTAGNLWPATFYAKQAEYAALTNLPFLDRLISLVKLPIVGVGILLLPGVIFRFFNAIREPRWDIISGYFWWIGYLLIYVIRLPVTYQHGRYLMPLMPVFFLWGISGSELIFNHIRGTKLGWVVSRSWFLATLVVLVAFWLLGARAYATDVAIIESEMVDTAMWIEKNSPQEAVIAAHDIGALGYYGDREIFDLAGLITPETIPFFSDEAGLFQQIQQAGSDYLMTFPDWYERLTQCGVIVHSSNAPFSPASGGSNMTVYKLLPGCSMK